MMSLNQYRINQLHQNSMMAQAERQRLVRAALAGRRGWVRFYGPLLAHMGNGLVKWGSSLEARYGTLEMPRRDLAVSRR